MLNAGKFKKGELVRKSHPHYKEIYPMMLAVHLAHTWDMKVMLESFIYEIFDEWEESGEEVGTYTTKQLWNEYFRPPWVRCSLMHTNVH